MTNGGDLIPAHLGLSRAGGRLCGLRRKLRQQAHLTESGLPGRAEDELMASGGLQAEAGNHSEGAELKSDL